VNSMKVTNKKGFWCCFCCKFEKKWEDNTGADDDDAEAIQIVNQKWSEVEVEKWWKMLQRKWNEKHRQRTGNKRWEEWGGMWKTGLDKKQ
jgi:hypothetical protein